MPSKKDVIELMRQIFTDDKFTELQEILTRSWGKLWINDMAKMVDKVVIPIGLTLILIYFLTEVIDHLQTTSATPEYIFKNLIKLFIGILVGANVCQYFLDINSAMNNFTRNISGEIELSVSGEKDNNKDDKKEESNIDLSKMTKKINKSNAGVRVGYYIWLFVCMIVVLLIKLSVSFIVYSRMLKQYLYTVFAPIGVSDIISGGFNSRGFKYIKQFIALCLQGAIIIVIFMSSNAVMAFIGAKGTGLVADFTIKFMADFLISQLIVVGLIGKSEQLAKEIVGV